MSLTEIRLINQKAVTLEKKNDALMTAIQEYHQAIQNIYTFVNSYLDNGGSPTVMPKHWRDLDAIRQVKYDAMIHLAGIQ